ncbi:hypothetical protein L596_029428 [Steinernema carpocapsae]|uniref:Uncharacterized protein n=1 Tax=Steinernema carpocapsae TaxID=34508 RepID=A0A4U5LUM3_STECR|nr:hypothetical protein L596_029428 [Steinernema carpocapsae]
MELTAAALRLVDYCVDKNIFVELLTPAEMRIFNEFFTGRQNVDEPVLVIFDKVFEKILTSEVLTRNEEIQKDLFLLNKDKADSKNHMLDALIARKSPVRVPTPAQPRSPQTVRTNLQEDKDDPDEQTQK